MDSVRERKCWVARCCSGRLRQWMMLKVTFKPFLTYRERISKRLNRKSAILSVPFSPQKGTRLRVWAQMWRRGKEEVIISLHKEPRTKGYSHFMDVGARTNTKGWGKSGKAQSKKNFFKDPWYEGLQIDTWEESHQKHQGLPDLKNYAEYCPWLLPTPYPLSKVS